MSKYLQTNGKLENSAIYTYAFNLPAVSTCPGAGICKAYCFAAGEQKRYPSAKAYRERSLRLTKSKGFVTTILRELDQLTVKHEKSGSQFAVRIHASGDFYSPAYVRSWFAIMEQRPGIQFYAYTKSIAIFKYLGYTPKNFTVIYSLGSNQDKLIDLDHDRHARIFKTEEEATAAGYAIGAEDDSVCWQSDNHRIGLVVFGATKIFARLAVSEKDNNINSLQEKIA